MLWPRNSRVSHNSIGCHDEEGLTHKPLTSFLQFEVFNIYIYVCICHIPYIFSVLCLHQVACRGNNKMLQGKHQEKQQARTTSTTSMQEPSQMDRLEKLLQKYAPARAGLPLLDASPASSQPVVPTPARSTAAPAATIAQPSEPLPLADVQEKAASAPEE